MIGPIESEVGEFSGFLSPQKPNEASYQKGMLMLCGQVRVRDTEQTIEIGYIKKDSAVYTDWININW